ncbi:MAG: S1C family serine protease, partial [Oscillospiraceae bacterium]|nr:S1C family serine protease [Oscillospiraceae bacterium]
MPDNFNDNPSYNTNDNSSYNNIYGSVPNNDNKINWTYSYSDSNFNPSGNSEINQDSNGLNNVNTTRYKKVKDKKHNYLGQFLMVLIACILCSSIVGGVLFTSFSSKIDKQNAIIQQLSSNKNVTSPVIGTSYGTVPDISAIVDEVLPSVVGIKLDITINPSGSRRFFSMQQQGTLEGSGIVLSQDGYIVTNYHVVSYADPAANTNATVDMEVHLNDGTIAKATFVGGDEGNDIAVIKVNLNNLKPATLGDSTILKAGETVITIGCPLGLEFQGTVTQGIISAANRSVDTGNGVMKNLIQTDAAINEGN